MDVGTDLGTAYHSLLLFLTGGLVLLIYDFERAHKEPSFGWIPVLAVFWGISIDELAELHNNAPEFLESLGLAGRVQTLSIPRWPIVLAPIAIVVVVYFTIFFIKKFKRMPRLFQLSVCASVIWFIAFWMEMLMATSMPHKLQVGIEEGLEKLGTSMFFVIFLSYYRRRLRE
ncbi:MAG TPA: hypothetical protein ENN07_04595 [candidate division Zixibacteria bacterium]|nr:hypothetical protein [candidate division Zixibacteria bacterium]